MRATSGRTHSRGVQGQRLASRAWAEPLGADSPRELRGCELGAEQMRGLSVQLVRYRVVREEAA